MRSLPKFDIIDAPFANGDSVRPTFDVGPSNADINFRTGIPPSFSVPGSNDSIRFTRHMMNQIGYLSTLGGFLDQIGCPQTFNQEFCDAIGGYPKGAILKVLFKEKDEVGNEIVRTIREVISLRDDNKVNFVENPSAIGDVVDGKIWWKFVEGDLDNDFGIPNLSRMREVFEETVSIEEIQTYSWQSKTYKFDDNSWIYLDISFDHWQDDMHLEDFPDCAVYCPKMNKIYNYIHHLHPRIGGHANALIPIPKDVEFQITLAPKLKHEGAYVPIHVICKEVKCYGAPTENDV